MDHYHVWLRSGRTFLMQTRKYEARQTAVSVARKLRPNRVDRMVLGCDVCPASVRSKRRPAKWGRIAARMAEALGLDAAEVRRALERARWEDRHGAA